jgi:hypothetical protein
MRFIFSLIPLLLLAFSAVVQADPFSVRLAIDEPGWKALGEADFTAVNSSKDTWSFDSETGVIQCSGKPISVIRTAKPYTNFELSVEWMHQKAAGNSGIFIWTSKPSLDALTQPGLPREGIEVQILDPGFTAAYEKKSGKKGDWFTCHGDVFAVGKASLKPFPPLSPDGSRSFPSAETTKPHGNWNHYYVRAINGEVRLWVNGKEVSGGNGSTPSSGYICLESEGSPIQFRNLKIRELP